VELLAESVVDADPAGRVQPAVADPVAPTLVLLVELRQRAEAARRPEAAL
jgi:hypothetical protein